MSVEIQVDALPYTDPGYDDLNAKQLVQFVFFQT